MVLIGGGGQRRVDGRLLGGALAQPLRLEARTEERQHGLAVLLREQAVEHEITGRVDCDHKIEEVVERVHDIELLTILRNVSHARVDQVDGDRQLAD